MQAPCLNKYWKLKGPWQNGRKADVRHRLEIAGYNSKTGSSSQHRYLLYRIEVGLICYNKCSNAELRKFAEDRSTLKHPRRVCRAEKHNVQEAYLCSSQGTRAGLIRSLIEADKRLQFRKFLDLPRELRDHVYEQYMAEFPPLTTPAQPPIAKVSRQVREEALSTFYACSAFVIVLNWPERATLNFSIEAISFLRMLTAGDLARVGDLSLVINPNDSHDLWPYGTVRITRDKDHKYTIDFTACRWMASVGSPLPVLNDMFVERKLSSGEKKLKVSLDGKRHARLKAY